MPRCEPLDRIVADAHRAALERGQGYREQALKLYPWVCGRCGRSFTRANLQELTVHHRNHDHDFNPPDGSNWELLCVYCHDNEHSRYGDYTGVAASEAAFPKLPTTLPGFPFKISFTLGMRPMKDGLGAGVNRLRDW